ncbi:MAG: hypothetical protein JXB00_11090 [Bacteroidales bacterium]|nr:hypothetical protein [Bacteroidales bacterium]
MKNNFRHNILIFLFFAVIVFIAYFFGMKYFGLYEDDYWTAGIPVNCNQEEIKNFLDLNFSDFKNNLGRYIAAIVSMYLPYFTFRTGSFFMVYFFGVILVALNALLVYLIFRQRLPEVVSLAGALVFILFPADTTKALLVHIYQLQLSLTFTFIGILLYLKNYRFWAYVVSFLSLITYENAFLAFIIIPLFENLKWDKKLLLQFIKHIGIVITIFIMLFITRSYFGDRVVTSLNMGEMIIKTLFAIIAGPFIAAYSFLKAPVETIANLDKTWGFILAGFLLLGSFMLVKAKGNYSNGEKASDVKFRLDFKKGEFFNIKEFDLIFKIVITAGLMMMVAYAFSITHFPPFALKGRGTSVHLGTTIGSSLMFSALFYFLLTIMRSVKSWRILIIITSIYLSLLVGYGRLIQLDFIKSWKIQRDFWADVIDKCPDVENGTIIFLKDRNLEKTDFIITYAWSLPLVYENLFRFPEEWDKPPKLQLIDPEMHEDFSVENKKLFYIPPYPFTFYYQKRVELQDGNVILLEKTDKGLKRLSGHIEINGLKIELKEHGKDMLEGFEKQNVYHWMFRY